MYPSGRSGWRSEGGRSPAASQPGRHWCGPPVARRLGRDRPRAMPSFTPQGLRALTHLVARRMGSDDTEATEVADHLVRANLAGHDSHGVGMLPTYVRLLHDRLLVPNQTAETILDSGALLIVDARRGYGQRMAADAVRRAITKAKEQ